MFSAELRGHRLKLHGLLGRDGAEPDVKVKAANALETAEKLAESKLQNK